MRRRSIAVRRVAVRRVAARRVAARHAARHVVIVAIVASAMPAAAAPEVPKAAPVAAPASPIGAPRPAAAPPRRPPRLLGAAVPSKAVSKLPAVETFALANGLQVAVLRDDAAPVVSVQLWYHAGSKDEPRDHRGTAHMFEHLMFKGSAHLRSDAHGQSINALGGYVNAATDEDATHFANTLPADYLDYAVQLEAERMRQLQFRKAMIDSERAVVEDEIRQQDASPFAKGLLRCLGISYLKHPYAWTSTGNARELDQTTGDDLKKFYDAYYQPNNALLVVVGKVVAADVKASAEKWFGPIAKAADPPRPAQALTEPAQTARRREVVEPGQIGLTLVGWHVPPAKDKDNRALQVATIVLGGGESSRLKVRLKTPDPKTKKPIALEAGMDAILREDPGMAIALGAYLDPAQSEPVESAIFDEVARLAARGPSADELRKAKNQIQSAFVFSLENAQGLGEAIGRSWILSGDPAAFLHEVDEVEKLSAGDVQRVVKQYLSPDHATVVVIPPKAH
jgi:zinc protease